jgi:hypothetical protein
MELPLSLETSIDYNKLYVLYDENNYSNKLEELLKSIRNIELTAKESKDNNTLIISDIYNYTINNRKRLIKDKLFTIIDDEKTLIFLQNKNIPLRYTGTNLKELITKYNGVIGYLNKTDDNLIKTLCLSLDISTKVNTQLISISDISSVDCLFIYNSLNNDYLYKSLDTNNNRYIFYDYGESVDINKIKFYFPYIKKSNIVLSDYFQDRKDLTIVKTLYSIDLVLYGPVEVELNVDLTQKLNDINVNQGNFDVINYYTMYFEFFKQTMDYLKLENQDRSINKSNLPILEQFLDGFYDSSKNTLYPSNQVTPDGLPLIPNSYIELNDQDREEENGVYKIQSNILLEKVNIKNPDDNIDKYICFNDPLIQDESKCAPLNWDRPCETNEECPFYQKNKNYLNYRGGCDTNKHCEMPLGIKSVAFRNYDSSSKAMCYGCDDLSANCCDTQDSPDYAFALDQFDRMDQNL